MAASLTESKVECRLQRGERVGEQLVLVHAVTLAHLVEVEYRPGLVFWNAVLELTDDNLPVLGKLGPGDGPIGVELPDGRKGFLFIVGVHQTSGFNAVIGVGKPNPSGL